MKELIINMFRSVGLSIGKFEEKRYNERKVYFRNKGIFDKYKDYTMIPELVYMDNLTVAELASEVKGDIVECGVWRGGMIAGISDVLGKNRKYWLFDSFEGLPPADAGKDGETAIHWQANKDSKYYYDNCAAEIGFAKKAMNLSGPANAEFVKGWFSETVDKSEVKDIAVLRLDGDWYESTMTCLKALYPKVVTGGIIILDDYYFWEGCSRALHDYFSQNSLTDKIHESPQGVAYIIKNKSYNEFLKRA